MLLPTKRKPRISPRLFSGRKGDLMGCAREHNMLRIPFSQISSAKGLRTPDIRMTILWTTTETINKMTLEQEIAHISKSYRHISDANAKYRAELAELSAENKILKERVALYDRMNHDLMSRLANAP